MFTQKYLCKDNSFQPIDKFACNEPKYVKGMYNEYYLQALKTGHLSELFTRRDAEAVMKQEIPDFMEGFVVTENGTIKNVIILRGGIL